MKNIHVLPTDKPSRLYYWEDKLVLGNLATTPINTNIYITNDEEIKEGDWFLTPTNDLRYADIEWLITISKFIPKSNFKKICLTTDQDLIKDGVQAIDDEFLEWFVKNPSCEEVEVVSAKTIPALQLTGNGHCWWKIIIPKEEPKQEDMKQTAVELLKQRLIKDQQVFPIYNEYINGILYDINNELLEMEKQQQGYSEEEMLKMLHKFGFDYTYNYKGEKTIYEWIPEWFEEYKRLEQLNK
jgi:hypothetical protein